MSFTKNSHKKTLVRGLSVDAKRYHLTYSPEHGKASFAFGDGVSAVGRPSPEDFTRSRVIGSFFLQRTPLKRGSRNDNSCGTLFVADQRTAAIVPKFCCFNKKNSLFKSQKITIGTCGFKSRDLSVLSEKRKRNSGELFLMLIFAKFSCLNEGSLESCKQSVSK